MDEVKRNRHAVYTLTYHIVLVTKFRHKCISDEIRSDLIRFSEELLAKVGCTLKEANGGADHLHLLVEMAPKNAPSVVVNSLKTVTSRLIRKTHPGYLRQFYWKPFFWSHSYFVSTTGGASIETIRRYIENQND